MKKLLVVFVLVLAMIMAVNAVAEETEITYESRGVQVPATLTVPDGVESYPIVIMAHGHGGNRNEGSGYIDTAKALAMQGIASIRMDFPGCGESTEPFTMNTLSNMKADVLAAVDYAKANLPVTTVGLFGYSMGGRIIIELIDEGFLPDAAVLLAPAVNYDIYHSLGEELAEQAIAGIEAEGHYAYTTRYGQNLDLSKEWLDDMNKYSYPANVDAAAEAYDGPMLVIYAADDAVVDPAASQYVADAFGCDVVMGTGNSHSYGFYSDAMDIRNEVVYGAAIFFTLNLK
ncbi:MAG: alpha/beta fold hydrolase [Oscillospiraceae bacterium]|nr:alpha/beta fold hydrolase [Oscillospiraceae bacterium]